MVGIHHQFNISTKDKNILRELAKSVYEISQLPIQSEKRSLWFDLNALKNTRPLIYCDPENGWNEIIAKSSLLCECELAQSWEMFLRKEIFRGQYMKDDKVIESYFDVPHIFSGHVEKGWGLETVYSEKDGHGSYNWIAPLKDYKDMDKLRYPEYQVDFEASEKLLNLAEEVFGNIFIVRRRTNWFGSLGLTRVLIKLRGAEQFLYDMYDYPDELHSLMAFLRDGHIAAVKSLEKKGLLNLNNYNDYVGSGGFGYTNELPGKNYDGDRVRTCDLWLRCESQETSYVSPQMFEEFVFQYQLPITELFGLNCYGCCEPLEKRWDIIKKIPRLRRVSVSPWCDLKEMSEKLENKYIYSMKPNPAHLAVPYIDEGFIRKDLKEAMEITRKNRVEVIMKDTHTIGKNPNNIIRWCEIAKELAETI